MKLKKTILITAAALSLAACPPQLVSAAAASEQSAQQNIGAVSPLSDNIVWVYKIKDGKLYKHLYDTSKDMWIGPWIYVCDYPG